MQIRRILTWTGALAALMAVAAWGMPLLNGGGPLAQPLRNKGKVHIRQDGAKYTLYRNGRPFFVQGASGRGDLASLAAAGGNTVRTYDTANLRAFLDEAQSQGLAVIAGLPIPSSPYEKFFYRDKRKTDSLEAGVRAAVLRYRDHPALLMWCLGNEPVMTWRPGHRGFYSTYNRLLASIHELDPDHPVTTTLPNFNIAQIWMIRQCVPGLDVISFNTFGRLHELGERLEQFSRIWNGPFLVAEWGAYGPWESEYTAWQAPVENTSSKKAEQLRKMVTDLPLQNPRCLGALAFYWGYRDEATGTWFSLFSTSGQPTEAVAALRESWGRKSANTTWPQIKYMLLGGKGARDNILLTPGSRQTASLFLDAANRAPIATLAWKVTQENWYHGTGRPKKPDIMIDTTVRAEDGLELSFVTPRRGGPYRIFVQVTDREGHVATANTPFYVVE
ncbi:glycoside hydrolase family 2 TIM barrel-domain containing protein [Chitinophaga caseinilytica]|uniref:Glycoside hydrolase family 2 TIM barrel-domain containing protein n=1 Tax=Chitinophaga caseinilytica TaxID=2267521 RepID=A0ABZ2Z5G7_9BACT